MPIWRHLDRVDLGTANILPMVENLALDPAPGIRSFMRLMQRSTVLLPHPDGPMSAVIWCFGTSKVTSVTARKLP